MIGDWVLALENNFHTHGVYIFDIFWDVPIMDAIALDYIHPKYYDIIKVVDNIIARKGIDGFLIVLHIFVESIVVDHRTTHARNSQEVHVEHVVGQGIQVVDQSLGKFVERYGQATLVCCGQDSREQKVAPPHGLQESPGKF